MFEHFNSPGRDFRFHALPRTAEATSEEIRLGNEGSRFEHEESCLHELFEAQADLTPLATAVVSGDECLSYRALDEQCNRLAHHLRHLGVGPGKLVAIYFDRSELPIVAILSVLKSGAAYLPIEPAYPEERVRHIFGEARPVLVLTEEALTSHIARSFAGPVIAIDGSQAAILEQSPSRLTRESTGVSPSDLCYVIYTSGTTGRPKGVMTEHRNTAFFARMFNRVCGTSPSDRVYQGFSLGFDGSVEEIWMAFTNGSALVVGDRAAPRFGNDLAEYLTKAAVTYFSTVPTLLSTMTEDIPTLKTLVVSGEVCGPEIALRWARPGRKLWNVYGPTEATVNTAAKLCVPGRPITIGKPLDGYGAFILDENRRPVPRGEKGELYVSGKGLCRGYLNQPALTSERFVTLPNFADTNEPLRLYRTGDIARRNDDGELEFFGRIDSQVKLRGYRIELSEIENVVLEHGRARSASVKLFESENGQALAAYVVPKDASRSFDRANLMKFLKARLPGYMIPAYLEVLDELPMLASGKVDRSLLPEPVSPLVCMETKTARPETALEEKIEKVWAGLFEISEVSVDQDFFLDLGGFSLLAARMVTRLRSELDLDATVRDVYRYPTVRKLAAYFSRVGTGNRPAQETREKSSREIFESLSPWRRRKTTLLQGLSIYASHAVGTSSFSVLLAIALEWYRGEISGAAAIGLGLGGVLLIWPLFLFLAILSKWVLVGKYRPGKYPLWGAFYFRWWLARKLHAMSGAGILSGTPFLSVYYRLMGAKVGKNCILGTSLCGSWDLVSIGEGTSIGPDTQLPGYRVENGMLVIGSLDIGKDCFVGAHSALGLDTKMGDGARLGDQSLLPDGEAIPPRESRKGSPCVADSVPVPEGPVIPSSRARRLALGVVQLSLAYSLGLFSFVPAGALFVGWLWLFFGTGILWGAVSLVVSVPAGIVASCLYFAALKRLILPSARPGVYSLYSAFYVRKWLSDGLMRAARTLLLPVYTTLYLPAWLRLMGAKIGKRAELSTVWAFEPELIHIGEESFLADGSILGGKRIYRDRVEVGVTRVGKRSFVGNNAVLPAGRTLGAGCLLGVLSTPPDGDPCVADGTEWLGSPAFSLPHRKKAEGFGDDVTFRPGKRLYAERAVIDAVRILFPAYVALFDFAAFVSLLFLSWKALGITGALLIAPIISVLTGLSASISVALLKKLVMGAFRPVIRPLWSRYVWLNEMVNGAYESVMAPFLAGFLGTPFAAPLLRLMGTKIGKHVFLDTTLFSEFDLVEIGDYAAINRGAVIQNHLFEDRVMKSDRLRIGDECSVGSMAVVLYGTEMERGSSIGPLSLLMKGESLAPFTRWHGIPVTRRN